MDIKLRTTKHRTITDSHDGSNNKQKVNNNRTAALEWTAAQATGEGGGGLNAFYWCQIFALNQPFEKIIFEKEKQMVDDKTSEKLLGFTIFTVGIDL